jgi:hypothetical protein
MVASEEGDAQIVKMLLADRRVDVNETNDLPVSLIGMSCRVIGRPSST